LPRFFVGHAPGASAFPETRFGSTDFLHRHTLAPPLPRPRSGPIIHTHPNLLDLGTGKWPFLFFPDSLGGLRALIKLSGGSFTSTRAPGQLFPDYFGFDFSKDFWGPQPWSSCWVMIEHLYGHARPRQRSEFVRRGGCQLSSLLTRKGFFGISKLTRFGGPSSLLKLGSSASPNTSRPCGCWLDNQFDLPI